MNFNESIEYIRGTDVMEYVLEGVGDLRWDFDRWLEKHGVPVFFTAELSDVKFAWFSLRYTHKCGYTNPIDCLTTCFDMFGGPRGTWQALNEEIRELRGY